MRLSFPPFSTFLVEKITLASRELARVRSAAATLQAILVHHVRTYEYLPHLRHIPTIVVEGSAFAPLFRLLPELKGYRLQVFPSLASHPGGSFQAIGNMLRIKLEGALGYHQMPIRDEADFDRWRLAAETAIKRMTPEITHEVTHLFQFLKDPEGYQTTERYRGGIEYEKYANTRHEVNAFVSGFISALDEIVRRTPSVLAGVHSFEDIMKVCTSRDYLFRLGVPLEGFFEHLAPRNQRLARAMFVRYLRDKKAHYSKFLDPVWFD